MRGRLINPFIAVLGQLDTASTTYVPLRREPTISYDPVTGARTSGRAETEARCVCQVETGTFELQQMSPTGNVPLSNMTLVFHYEDLAGAGLIGPNNRPKINVGDRLKQILNVDDESVASDFARSPLYITEATPSGFGFGGRVNLLVCRISDRPQGQRQ